MSVFTITGKLPILIFPSDDRTLHEYYLWPFAEAVRAGVGSVMCSYNQVNYPQVSLKS